MAPSLAAEMRCPTNNSVSSAVIDPVWKQKEVIAAACKVTLLWPGVTRVTGAAVAAAIKRNHVGWPSVGWWRETVLDEFKTWSVGTVAEQNYGGGMWDKPCLTEDDTEDDYSLLKKLTYWGVSKANLLDSLPTKSASSKRKRE